MKSDRIILVPLPQQAKVRGSNPLGRATPVLLIVGATSASLAGEAPFLGDWARVDGKTRIWVAFLACGKRHTGNVGGPTVRDRLIRRNAA
jgi:hypothetical protein